MKKLLGIFGALLVALTAAPVFGADTGANGLGVTITPEDFGPLVWLCDNRVLADDSVQQGRNGAALDEREQNYAFTDEQISWDVLVMDKNGINKIADVFGEVDGSAQTPGLGQNLVNCQLTGILANGAAVPAACNARIDEEVLTLAPADNVMATYTCTLTVPSNLNGEYWVRVTALDLSGETGSFVEEEYWFLNPTLGLLITDTIDFGNVRPGTNAYSAPVRVQSTVETGSGVRLDVFMSGQDLSMDNGAQCPVTNSLTIADGAVDGCGAGDALCYYATNGAYSTVGNAGADAEGYLDLAYGTSILDAYEAIGTAAGRDQYETGALNAGNVLTPGSEMTFIFKLKMPLPCTGDFVPPAQGDEPIFIWGEAI